MTNRGPGCERAHGERPRRRRCLAGTGLVLALIGPGCARGAATNAQGPGSGTAVEVALARNVSVDEATEYLATLKSRSSAVIMPQVEGQVTEIFVRSGEQVSPGTPLMQIDPAKQQATLKSQEDTLAAKRANLEFARQQYDRVAGLSKAGIVSGQDLDQARAAHEAAKAELAALEAQVREEQVQLRYYQVVAPTAGILGDIPVRVGDRVTVGTMLTTVDQTGTLEAYIHVPAERAPRLRIGMPVRILESTGGSLADTRVSFISPQVDDATQSVLVKARIDDRAGALRPAQLVRARVVWDIHEGPVVPVLAVARISGQYFAFVAEGKDGALVARQRPLRVGEIVGNDYVVLEGIKAGDRVIVSGTQFLVDGAPVTPKT